MGKNGDYIFLDNIDLKLILPIHGWNNIYFRPANEPNLNFCYFYNNFDKKSFISSDKYKCYGNDNYSNNIDCCKIFWSFV